MKRNVFAGIATISAIICLSFSTSLAASPGGDENNSKLSGNEADDLIFMREEEKLARDSYIVLFEKWGLPIFDSISESEQRHMHAIKNLIDHYGLTDPVEDESVINDFDNHELADLFVNLMDYGLMSKMNGLTVGAWIEETDIEDINLAIERADHENIIETYESLLCGSRNHLRAFVGQIEMNGEVYEPIIFSVDEIESIVDSPTERDCGDIPDTEDKSSRDKRGKGRR